MNDNRSKATIKRNLENNPMSNPLTRKKISNTRKRLFKEGKLKSWNRKNDVRNDYKEIIRLYKNELISTIDIGKKYGCSDSLIERILKENNVLMTHSERRKILTKVGKYKSWNKDLTKETDERVKKYTEKRKSEFWNKQKEIINLYLKELLSPKEIANIYRCNCSIIYDILRENKVLMGGSKRRKLLFKEGKIKIWNEDLTIETDERIKDNILKMNKWREINIKDKTYEEIYGEEKAKEIKEKQSIFSSGKNNPMYGKVRELSPNWNNGSSFEPYGIEFNKGLKEHIRIRDNHQCQECGKPQQELKKKLNTHHIDYNKLNNNPTNLISLCSHCHLKTNLNRKHWENYFKMKIFIKELFNPQNILIYNENKQLIGMERIQ